MKKQLLILVLLLLPMVVNAFTGEVEIDGIKYFIITKGKTAEVIRYSYSGNIVIPSTIKYDGVVCSVTSIGDGAFWGCSSLTSITIPNSVTSIGELAFQACYSLTSITIPNSVTSIGEHAFYGCSSLTSVTIPNSVTTIGHGTFYNCSSLTSVTIPNSVKIIEGTAFERCSSLTSVTIPNSVKIIEGNAFYGCSSLTSVTIPNSVTDIHLKAFSNCPELTNVYCYAEKVPSTDGDAFEGSYIEHANLFVPEASVNEYKKSVPWSGFKNIKPLSGEEPSAITNIPAKAVMIQGYNGMINIQGAEEGTPVSVYSINGTKEGTATISNGAASVNTTLPPGSIAVVKIAEKSIKVIMR